MEHFSGVRPTVWQAEQLSFAWPGRAIFKEWSGQIPSGVTWLGGDESSGKTTLLKLMAGELVPQAGRLSIKGVQLDEDAPNYKQQVFWTDPLSTERDQASARDYFNDLPARCPRFNREALVDLTSGLNLAELLDKPLYMLSTGSRRKVWLAASFASGAALTLIEHPFAGLDKASIGFLLEVLQDVATHAERAWVVADYTAPATVPLADTIHL